MDGHHPGIQKRDLEWVGSARGVDLCHPLIDIENHPRPPFWGRGGEEVRGLRGRRAEMVFGEALQIETEGAVTVNDEHRILVAEQSPVPGHSARPPAVPISSSSNERAISTPSIVTSDTASAICSARWETLTTIRVAPADAASLSAEATTGPSGIGRAGLGRTEVSGRMRSPRPAARIIAVLKHASRHSAKTISVGRSSSG